MQQQKKKTEKTGKSILSWTHLDYRAGLWRNMFPSDTGDWHFRFVIRPVNLFCLTYLIFFFFFLLGRLISFSLLFFMLLKGCFQDAWILLSPCLPPLMEAGEFCLCTPMSLGLPYKGLINSGISRRVCWPWNTLALSQNEHIICLFNILLE